MVKQSPTMLDQLNTQLTIKYTEAEKSKDYQPLKDWINEQDWNVQQDISLQSLGMLRSNIAIIKKNFSAQLESEIDKLQNANKKLSELYSEQNKKAKPTETVGEKGKHTVYPKNIQGNETSEPAAHSDDKKNKKTPHLKLKKLTQLSENVANLTMDAINTAIGNIKSKTRQC